MKGTFAKTKNKGDKITMLTKENFMRLIDCCTDLGGGRYFTDLAYHIRTYGLTDPTEETYRMRLLVKEEVGTLFAEQMYLS